MILGKALLLKGLGGVTALGATATAAYFVFSNNDSSKELLEKAGLKCNFNGNECEITSLESGKKINVKNNTTKVEEKTFTISTSGPKIKVQKNVAASEGYNKNLKLTIEGGDIDLTNGAASGSNSITKLEQFETYEIVKEGDKYYLSWKRTAIDEKSKALGLPDNCKLPSDNNTPTICSNITQEQLKAIKFDGKSGDGATIDNNGTNTITLTITKVDSTDSIFGTGGYKFAFNSTQDLSIPKTGSDSISIKKGTNTEFRIKETTTTGSTAKTLSLEKAWTVTTLAEKVGLTNCSATGGTKECTLPTSKKINVAFSSDDKSKEATIQDSDSSKKLTYEEDAADHNQGFKFTTSTEISLSEPNGKKIEASTGTGNPSYEIKEIDGQWYLAKKTTAS